MTSPRSSTLRRIGGHVTPADHMKVAICRRPVRFGTGPIIAGVSPARLLQMDIADEATFAKTLFPLPPRAIDRGASCCDSLFHGRSLGRFPRQ